MIFITNKAIKPQKIRCLVGFFDEQKSAIKYYQKLYI